ncbi:MAG TPA: Tol-Pal system beta propeller repeat protein TolB [Candidatus Dormibacteraeota bacterium]|nr:Tol-Pal system beta propeller repeat protein TolB [Candidatus Dormibacteraeota bacterium]
MKSASRRLWVRVLVAFLVLGVSLQKSLSQSGTPPPEAPIPSVPIIRIIGAAKPKQPIALPAFTATGDSKAQDAARTIHDTIRDDLDFSGYFLIIPDEYYKLVHADPGGRNINYKEWVGVGADALLLGQTSMEPGNLVFESVLHDTMEQKILLHKKYRGESDQARLVAHKLSDAIVEQFIGQPGIAQTKIAFVSQVGKAKEIYVMDYDGARAKRITANNTINLSPAWSPDGRKIAFVSFRSGTPVLMIVNSDGELSQAFPQEGDLNSAPAWSPDGRSLAFASTRDGNAEIYVQRIDKPVPTRITKEPAIDTSPTWSPDGTQIAFTSDRAGSPRIYIMDSDGGNVRPFTPEIGYCDAASWSPLGDKIAFTARVPGGFDIFVKDIKTGQVGRLTENSNINEWPRWSPDGRHLVFASNRTGNFDIFIVDLDGTHARRLSHGGNSYSPSWSR